MGNTRAPIKVDEDGVCRTAQHRHSFARHQSFHSGANDSPEVSGFVTLVHFQFFHVDAVFRFPAGFLRVSASLRNIDSIRQRLQDPPPLEVCREKRGGGRPPFAQSVRQIQSHYHQLPVLMNPQRHWFLTDAVMP